MTYTLHFSNDRSLADEELFSNLDRARDIAFEISLETSREVSIFCGSHLWETVMA